jgi:uncharacterized protein (DUF1697 family)
MKLIAGLLVRRAVWVRSAPGIASQPDEEEAEGVVLPHVHGGAAREPAPPRAQRGTSLWRVRQIVLLRGVNVGGRNKLAMPALREALEDAGMRDVVTYVQSGNVVLESAAKPAALAREVEAAIAEGFGLEVGALVRTRAELARIVRADPLGDVAGEEKLYQVTFCASKPDAKALAKVAERAVEGERLLARGKEIFAWFPHGVGRSKLAAALSKQNLGVLATARNWTTVKKLLELASA